MVMNISDNDDHVAAVAITVAAIATVAAAVAAAVPAATIAAAAVAITNLYYRICCVGYQA